MNDIRFDGRVAIVTGAGNGLGRAYALELARRGAKVVVNDLGSSGSGVGASSSAALTVVEEIRAAGGEAVPNFDSVATRTGGAAIVQTALDTWGKVDILISNAGFLRNARFEDLTDEQIDPIIDVHMKAAFYVGQTAFRAMREQGYGRILFTGSGSGMFGHAWQANYAAAKAAMVGISNVVAIEGAAYGITANVILPNADSRLAKEMDPGFLEIPSFAQAIGNAGFIPERLVPQYNTPLALYLVSEACTASHGIYSTNTGNYSRVRICVAEGWLSPPGATPPSVEDIAANFGEISELRNYSEPMNNYEEMTTIAAAVRRQREQQA